MHPPESDPNKQLSEQDIQAYVDGASDAQQTDQIHAYLNQTPDEAGRVAFYRRLNARLQADFALTPDSASADYPALAVRRTVRAHRRRRIVGIGGMVFGLVLSVLGALTWNVRPLDVLTPFGVIALEDAMSGVDACASGTTRCNLPANTLDLSPAGFHATQSTRLSIGGVWPTRSTLYRNQEGAPAVLLSLPNWRLRSQNEWQARRVGTIRVLSWTHGTRFYVLVAEGNARGLMKAADLAATGITGKY